MPDGAAIVLRFQLTGTVRVVMPEAPPTADADELVRSWFTPEHESAVAAAERRAP